MVDNNSTKMVSYSYDAWGKMLSKTGTLASTLGTIQPFRYRGYVYDEETGLYYLRCRYLNPSFGRFLNTDFFSQFANQPTGCNLFLYANNSPIALGDKSGRETIVILFDGRPDGADGGKGFPNQANWIKGCYSETDNVIMLDFVCIKAGSDDKEKKGFVERWNEMPDVIDQLHIVCHGSNGTLDCDGVQLGYTDPGNDFGFVSASELKNVTVKNFVWLYSCNGGTPDKNGVAAADFISAKTGGSLVYASAFASVNYWPKTGLPYGVPDFGQMKSVMDFLRSGWQFFRNNTLFK